MGEWRHSSTILDVGTRWTCMVASRPGCFIPVEKAPRTYWPGVECRSGRCGEEKTLLSLPEIEPPIIRPAGSNVASNNLVRKNKPLHPIWVWRLGYSSWCQLNANQRHAVRLWIPWGRNISSTEFPNRLSCDLILPKTRMFNKEKQKQMSKEMKHPHCLQRTSFVLLNTARPGKTKLQRRCTRLVSTVVSLCCWPLLII
jgi:hypothetical protein